MSEEKTIWEKQEELKRWHEQEYKQAYPNSTFYTGRDLAERRTAKGGKTWEELTPEEQERKEQVAYLLNRMLFSMGVNISSNFREKEQP